MQALAQLLARVGIATRVEAMPSSVYFSRATKLEFSFMLLGWAASQFIGFFLLGYPRDGSTLAWGAT